IAETIKPIAAGAVQNHHVITGFQIPTSVADRDSVPHSATRLFATQGESRPAAAPSVPPPHASPEARIQISKPPRSLTSTAGKSRTTGQASKLRLVDFPD